MWKWLLSVAGIGVVALALTIPNGAVLPCIDDTTKPLNERITTCPIPVNERASFKGKEIAKQVKNIARTNVKFSNADYDIEIVSTRAIPDGIEVLARAWDTNGQIGFGKDGTVDTERFIFINPPILVDDLLGNITRDNGEFGINKYREDLKEATLQSLAHTIKIKKQKFNSEKIVANKIGNTTLTAYPQSGTGTAPMDDRMQRDTVNEIFSTIQNGAGTGIGNNAADDFGRLNSSGTTDQFQLLSRAGFGFNTSSIGTDTIDSAIFSLAGNGTATLTELGDTDIDLVSFTPTDGANFAASDYAIAQYGTTRFATGKALSAFNTTAGTYNDWTLNANGLAGINKTGNTYFGTRLKWDVDNSFTGTWGTNINSRAVTRYADTAGTTSDPKLVVEHTAGATGKPRRQIIQFKPEQAITING